MDTKTYTLNASQQAVLFSLLRGAQGDLAAAHTFSGLYLEPTGLGDEEASDTVDELADMFEG